MLRKRVFIVIGLDFASRKSAIDSLKKRLIPQKSSCLNHQVYYGRDIDFDKLRSLFLSFSFEKERIVVFKEPGLLSKEVKDFLYNNIKDIIKNNYLIFEFEKDYFFFKKDKQFINDRLFGYILKYASLIKIASFRSNVSIRKLMDTITNNRLQDALYVLESVFDNAGKNKGFIGMQILGAITRKFSYTHNPIERKRCFDLIWDTERMLKGRKIEDKTALQILITKLLLR
ncbi:MAG: hypothetical protein B1H08_04695 [Candidatus Omnitrophica bacterium 4484_171]|nr:MAG: hypothetical protein B1H08_04695 [Candidatus Omnitrophica bacterium 4484_171]